MLRWAFRMLGPLCVNAAWICFSLLLLFLLICLVSLFRKFVALWIKPSSDGPVFFKQRRVGLNKRVFKIYKFRTMVPDAEQMMTHLEQHKRNVR